MSDRVSRVLLRIACAGALALSCAVGTPRQHLDAGTRAVKNGDVAGAQREFEAGRALEKQAPTGLLPMIDVELADLYLTYPELGRESEAGGLYKEALAQAEAATNGDDAKYPGLLQRLGDYYLIEERWADAIPILERWLVAARAQASVDQIYESSQASGLAKAYGAVGRKADQAKLRELIDDPLARKALAAAAAKAPAAAAAAPTAPAAAASGAIYLEPNARDREGRPIYVHWSERDMPLRVALPLPDEPATDGDEKETRDAAAQGIRAWESALAHTFPWFRVQIVDEDPNAQVQVVWARRPRSYSAGFGEIRLDESGPEPRTRATMTLSTQPVPTADAKLDLGFVHAHAVHAFGGALGLGYCWECDSVRSMDWLEAGRLEPSDADVRTLQALAALPNGKRAADDVAAPEPGLLADLPFLNLGTDRQIYVDLAPPDKSSFVVQLDTGAPVVVATPAYAKVLGIAASNTKATANFRDTVIGKPVGVWVTSQFGGSYEAMDYALLGGEFLKDFVIEIDYAHRRLRFFDPDRVQVGGPKPRAGEHVVKMPIAEGYLHTDIQLGTGKLRALVDTGDEGSISISEEAAAQLGIAVDPSAPRRTWHNVMGTMEASVQTVPRLGIGELSVEDVEVDIALRGTGVRIERMGGREVLVGQGVLRRFLVRLDYPRQRMGLTPQ